MHEAGEELVALTKAFIEEDMATIASEYRQRYGLERADEMIATFRPILDKWVELAANIDSNEALADLYWREAFSKVDVSDYAL